MILSEGSLNLYQRFSDQYQSLFRIDLPKQDFTRTFIICFLTEIGVTGEVLRISEVPRHATDSYVCRGVNELNTAEHVIDMHVLCKYNPHMNIWCFMNMYNVIVSTGFLVLRDFAGVPFKPR